MAKRSRISIFLLVVVLSSSSCAVDERRKTEIAVQQAIEQFHERLNQEQYPDIYLQADAELRSRINEFDFTSQLASTHRQLGKITTKSFVSLEDTIRRGVRRAFSLKRELVPQGELVASETVLGQEKFVWAVENNQARLVSYEFRFLCNKPCSIGFGP